MSESIGAELDEERDAEARVEAGEDNLDNDMGELEEQDRRVVRWYGQPGVDYREISVGDWNHAGVDLEKDSDGNDRTVPVSTIRWDKSNDYAVPLSALGFLSEEQVARYIDADNRFRIEER